MTVKLLSNYATSNELLKRFNNNYHINDEIIKFTTGDNFDIAVIFNSTTENTSKCSKIITLSQEPSWSPVWINNRFLNDSHIFITHDRNVFNTALT
jgi:hypothetical protein